MAHNVTIAAYYNVPSFILLFFRGHPTRRVTGFEGSHTRQENVDKLFYRLIRPSPLAHEINRASIGEGEPMSLALCRFVCLSFLMHPACSRVSTCGCCISTLSFAASATEVLCVRRVLPIRRQKVGEMRETIDSTGLASSPLHHEKMVPSIK